MLRNYLKLILSILVRRTLSRYKPFVIGVTGSVGKTTTKDAIFAVLERKFRTVKSQMTLNDEIGVPLSVLRIKPAGTHLIKATWKSRYLVIQGILEAIWRVFGPYDKTFPELLILELGADNPGGIGVLTDLVKPDIVVVTAIGDIPVHVENYPDVDSVVEEKAKILRFAVPPLGVAILNADDPRVIGMLTKTLGPSMLFGLSSASSVWASDISYYASENHEKIDGLSFAIHFGAHSKFVRVPKLMAVHQLYSVLASVCVGIHLGMDFSEICHRLEEFTVPSQRMNIEKTSNGTWVIDDSYNASPIAMESALETLHEFGRSISSLSGVKTRTIAVLGDMKELGKYTEEAHMRIGKKAAHLAEYIFTVGTNAKIISKSAESEISKKHIREFENIDEAQKSLLKFFKPNDVILIKGSRAMQMERIVDAIKASGKL